MTRLLIASLVLPLFAQKAPPPKETSHVPQTFQGQWVDMQCNVYGFTQKADKLEVNLPELRSLFEKWELPDAKLETETDGTKFTGDLKSTPAVHLEGIWRGGWIETIIRVEKDAMDLVLIPRDDASAKGCRETRGKEFPSSLEMRTSAASSPLDGKVGVAVFLKDATGKYTTAQKDIAVKLAVTGGELPTTDLVVRKGSFFNGVFVKPAGAGWGTVTAKVSGAGKAQEGFCGCNVVTPQPISKLSLSAPADGVLGQSVPVYIRFLNARGECAAGGEEKTLRPLKFGPGDFVTSPVTAPRNACAIRADYVSNEPGSATARVTFVNPGGDLTDNVSINWHYPNSLMLMALGGLGGLIGVILRKYTSAASDLYALNPVVEGLFGIIGGIGMWFAFYTGFRRANIVWALAVGLVGGYLVKIVLELLTRAVTSARKA